MPSRILMPLIVAFSSIAHADGLVQDSGYLDLQLTGRVISEILTDVPDDIVGIVRAPFDNPDAARDYALILGGLILTDKYLTSVYQDDIEPAITINLPDLNPEKYPSEFMKSDRYLATGLVGAYASSIILSDEKGQAAALLSAKAGAYSYIFSHVILKPLFGRNRPHRDLSDCGKSGEIVRPGFTCDNLDFGNEGSTYFKVGGLATSMPSFHATLYTSVARVYQQTYGNYIVPYSLAALLFANDIKDHNHWVSDLFAGVITGIVIGDVVTGNFFDDNDDLSVIPIINNDSQGVFLTYLF